MTPRTAWDSEGGLWELGSNDQVRWISHVVFGDVQDTNWRPRDRVEAQWGPLIPSA